MKIVTFLNANGDEIKLTNSSPIILEEIDISNSVNIYNSKGMLEDGASYSGNTLDIKEISLKFAVIANNQEELIEYKRMINKVFNPKLEEGTLYYKDNIQERKIKGIINKLPYFSDVAKNITECLVDVSANNPYWTDIDETKAEIALWKGQFHFPLIIPKNKGITMGIREPSLIVNVNNNGDVKTGMVIEFKAKGSLKNPSLYNVNTREYIKINKEMVAGEVVRVNTNFNNKRIESILNGVTTNILNLIDLGGGDTFLQLDVGDNLLRYNSDTNLSNLEVSIYYNPKYLGV